MAEKNYFKLYSMSAEPLDAYLLVEGNVYFFASEVDKYAITGNNLIIGSTEIILSNILDLKTPRIETAIADSAAKIKKIPINQFMQSLEKYSFILNISMVLAKQVHLTNEIINKNLSSMKGDEKKSKENAIEFYRIVRILKKEYDNRKLPWLKELVVKYENTLTFKRGETFDKSSEPTKLTTKISLTEKYIEYPIGSVICDEDTSGEEMYILQSGTIDVFIKNNRVATISEQGSVFGEMALLLGEKRTATLKAKNNVVLTVIKKNEIKDTAEKQNDIFIGIASSLAKKHYFNVEKINGVNKLIIEQTLSEDKSSKEKRMMETSRITNDLLSLKKDITDLAESKEAEFLKIF
jgi:CRP-like cAMP-binding protein